VHYGALKILGPIISLTAWPIIFFPDTFFRRKTARSGKHILIIKFSNTSLSSPGVQLPTIFRPIHSKILACPFPTWFWWPTPPAQSDHLCRPLLGSLNYIFSLFVHNYQSHQNKKVKKNQVKNICP
jgi:hypothetical protein